VDNIKMDHRKIGLDSMDWIDVADYRDQWRAASQEGLSSRKWVSEREREKVIRKKNEENFADTKEQAGKWWRREKKIKESFGEDTSSYLSFPVCGTDRENKIGRMFALSTEFYRILKWLFNIGEWTCSYRGTWTEL
jgi:hypothetical protein